MSDDLTDIETEEREAQATLHLTTAMIHLHAWRRLMLEDDEEIPEAFDAAKQAILSLPPNH